MFGKVLIVLLCAVLTVAHGEVVWGAIGLTFIWLIARDLREQEPEQ
jgi:hypothetical protein